MKPIPLYLIVARLKRLPLPERVNVLCGLVKAELPHSVRRNELQSLLEGARLRQLRKENRAA
jgi:hypothetical protein